MANTDTTINAIINPQINDAPIDIEKTIKALERNNFVVHYFETGADAVAYLQSRIQHKRVAIGDSRTLLELKVHDALSRVNDDITDIQRQNAQHANHGGYYHQRGFRILMKFYMSMFYAVKVNKA